VRLRLIQPLFPVTLSAQPSNTAIAVNPVINIGFAFYACDFSRVSAGIFRQDISVIVRVSDCFERHFCFCHVALWRIWMEIKEVRQHLRRR
jgi:hypothetical protein